MAWCQTQAVCRGRATPLPLGGGAVDVASYLRASLPSCLPVCSTSPTVDCCAGRQLTVSGNECGQNNCDFSVDVPQCWMRQKFVDGEGNLIELPTVWVNNVGDLDTAFACRCL